MLQSKCDSTTSFKPQMSIVIPVVVIVAIIAIAVLSLSGCGGSSAGSSSAESSSSNATEPAPIKTVDDYSWEELSEISAEISNETTEEGAIEIAKKYNLVNSDGKLDGSQTKEIQLSDGSIATVQIAGFLHDDKTGGGKAGITFIFQDVIARHDMNPTMPYDPINGSIGAEVYENDNSGGWERSAMRSWLSIDGLSLLPEDLADRIVVIDKKTNNVGKSESVASVTTTSDKLWLYSACELAGKSRPHSYSSNYAKRDTFDEIINAEGVQYKLFRDCDVNANASNEILTKNYDGSPLYWWTRSADPETGGDFYECNGHVFGSGNASDSDGVVPGFCI